VHQLPAKPAARGQPMSAAKKNTRRAAMDAERFDWRCFRFADDKRQWKAIAKERRAYFVKAANAANQDGTHVEISVKTFMKAGGERATAFRRLDELAEMGSCLPVLHVDARGYERELLSPRGAKVRRLRFDSLLAAQDILDAGQMFAGHPRLSADDQRAIQREWLREEVSNSCQEVSNTNGEEVSKPNQEVSNSGEEVSKPSKEVSNSCQEVSRIGETHTEVPDRKPLTENEKPKERETVTAPTQKQNSKSPSPSCAALAEPAQAGGQEETQAEKDEANRQTIERIIDRVKLLSKGKAQVTKSAKADLLDACRELGPFKMSEIDKAINAKINLCSDDFSYVNFGTSLAADLVATIRRYRALETARVKREKEHKLQEQWLSDLRAVQGDLTIDLDDWYELHSPTDICEMDSDFEHESAALFRIAEEQRKEQIKRVAEAVTGLDADGIKLNPTAEDLFGTPAVKS
jgi:hypothetical protein